MTREKKNIALELPLALGSATQTSREVERELKLHIILEDD